MGKSCSLEWPSSGPQALLYELPPSSGPRVLADVSATLSHDRLPIAANLTAKQEKCRKNVISLSLDDPGANDPKCQGVDVWQAQGSTGLLYLKCYPGRQLIADYARQNLSLTIVVTWYSSNTSSVYTTLFYYDHKFSTYLLLVRPSST